MIQNEYIMTANKLKFYQAVEETDERMVAMNVWKQCQEIK